jgi:hypothetical protein
MKPNQGQPPSHQGNRPKENRLSTLPFPILGNA